MKYIEYYIMSGFPKMGFVKGLQGVCVFHKNKS